MQRDRKSRLLCFGRILYAYRAVAQLVRWRWFDTHYCNIIHVGRGSGSKRPGRRPSSAVIFVCLTHFRQCVVCPWVCLRPHSRRDAYYLLSNLSNVFIRQGSYLHR